MVDISSQNNKINITVSSSGNTANTNVTPDYAQYYSEKSKEWAISNRIVDNTDYSSKYYANESKKQADISTAKATEVIESGNTALSSIDTAKDNAITSITNQETTSKTSLIDEGATQVGLIQQEGATQVANVQSTGFYMRDDKLYFINSQGEETEFKSGGPSLELCDIGTALYVDETQGKRRYLNGQIVDINTNTQAWLNRLLQIKATNPDYFTTEDNWQSEATLNVDGCVYKFVLNYSGGNVVSVRLPKYPDYVEINAGGTLPVVGNGMTIGLTDGTTNYGFKIGAINQWGNSIVSTDLYGKSVGTANTTASSIQSKSLGLTTDSRKSGVQTTLKQTKLKLRYFIQVATGSETENNIINDIELNNPYSLFDSKYSDHELNNLSWLKSAGQWNAKAVYPTAYDKLLKVYNGTETVEGLSVKLSTETYTDYDFVLNTAEETFRLPLKNHTADDGNSILTLYFYVGETVQNANLIDAGRIGEILPTKTDMQQAAKASMPSNRYIDLTLGKSGSTYIASANGTFVVGKRAGAVGEYINIIVLDANGEEICPFWSDSGASAIHRVCGHRIEVQKGQKIRINYNLTGVNIVFRFFYAEGNK